MAKALIVRSGLTVAAAEAIERLMAGPDEVQIEYAQTVQKALIAKIERTAERKAKAAA